MCPIISSPFQDLGLYDSESHNEAVFTDPQERSIREAAEELSKAWGTFKRGMF